MYFIDTQWHRLKIDVQVVENGCLLNDVALGCPQQIFANLFKENFADV